MAEMQIIGAEEYGTGADRFLVDHGGVFFQPALRSLGKPSADAWIILDESGQPMGGFNTMVTALRGVSTLAQPHLHPHCALFAIDAEGKTATRIARRKKVLEALGAFLKQRKERIISLALPTSWSDVQPLIWMGFSTSIKYTYRKSLDRAHDDGYTTELRGHIRKALSSKIEVTTSATRDELASVLIETADAQGFRAPIDGVTTLLDACTKGWCHLEAVRTGEELVGFAFTVFDRDEAYYLLGALSRSNKMRGVQPVLLDRSLMVMQQSGIAVYDFEGSMIPGVERFFRSFGGEIQAYYAIGRAPWLIRHFLRRRGVAGF